MSARRSSARCRPRRARPTSWRMPTTTWCIAGGAGSARRVGGGAGAEASAADRRRGDQRFEVGVDERLHQVTVEARVRRLPPILLLPPAGERDDRDLLAPGLRAELAADIEPVQLRQ